MKRTTFLNLFILGFVLIFGVTACHKNPKGTTVIPGVKPIIGNGNTTPIEGGGRLVENPVGIPGEIAQADRGGIEGRPQNREMFAANTVYFDLDSATVKSKEAPKLESVASYFKSNPAGDLLIEGHCDERGTEGYNLSLGDKRANALREYLVNLGVSPERVHTLSLGESVPAATGTGESVWSKNRRGEFVFVEPAK